jgi:hypothetical protein
MGRNLDPRRRIPAGHPLAMAFRPTPFTGQKPNEVGQARPLYHVLAGRREDSRLTEDKAQAPRLESIQPARPEPARREPARHGPARPVRDFLAGGGELGALLRSHAWEHTALDAPAS